MSQVVVTLSQRQFCLIWKRPPPEIYSGDPPPPHPRSTIYYHHGRNYRGEKLYQLYPEAAAYPAALMNLRLVVIVSFELKNNDTKLSSSPPPSCITASVTIIAALMTLYSYLACPTVCAIVHKRGH